MPAVSLKQLFILHPGKFLAGYCLIFFVFTLSPAPAFGPLPGSNIEIKPDRLNFLSRSLVASDPGPSTLNSSAFQEGRFSVDLEVTPQTTEIRQGRILAFSRHTGFQNWIVAQNNADLLIRHRGRTCVFENVFEAFTPIRLVLVFTFDGVSMYSTEQKVRFRSWEGSDHGWDSNSRFVLGNEVTGDRPWLGELIRLRLFRFELNNDAVSMLLAGAEANPTQLGSSLHLVTVSGKSATLLGEQGGRVELSIYTWPGSLKLRRLVSLEYLLETTKTVDVILNVLIGIPLGIFVAFLFKRRSPLPSVATAVALQLCVSCIAEAGQFFSYDRFTSLLDIATNTGGAAFGAMLCSWINDILPALSDRLGD